MKYKEGDLIRFEAVRRTSNFEFSHLGKITVDSVMEMLEIHDSIRIVGIDFKYRWKGNKNRMAIVFTAEVVE